MLLKLLHRRITVLASHFSQPHANRTGHRSKKKDQAAKALSAVPDLLEHGTTVFVIVVEASEDKAVPADLSERERRIGVVVYAAHVCHEIHCSTEGDIQVGNLAVVAKTSGVSGGSIWRPADIPFLE